MKYLLILLTMLSVSAFGQTTNSTKCFGDSTGHAYAKGHGGTPPYTYLWSNGSTKDSLFNLPAGTYTVTVTDANNCSVMGSVIVIQPTLLQVNIAVSNPVCVGDSGKLIASVIGGTPQYTYSWGSNTKTASPGTYPITVTDSNGCTATATAVIIPPAPSFHDTISKVICQGQNFEGHTKSGQYIDTFISKSGCDSIVVKNLVVDTVKITIVSTDVQCHGGNDGSATVTLVTGFSPLTIAWSNGMPVWQIFNLVAGTYSVTVTDSAGCNVSATTVVSQPLNPLNIETGMLDVNERIITTSGGTEPYGFFFMEVMCLPDGRVRATTL